MSCKKNLRHLHHLRNPSPHNLAQTFDGPPSLERSGSEHRRAVTSSLFGQERGLVRKVEPSLMGKSDANECNESSLSNCRVQLALSTKKDGMILEQISLQERRRGRKNSYNIKFRQVLLNQYPGKNTLKTILIWQGLYFLNFRYEPII